jgi:CDP-diacylglycerol--serine O-phosphatidyltransferase
MLVVRFDIWSFLRLPLHQSWFGANKTWRGMVVMPLFTLPGVQLAALAAEAWGVPLFKDAPLGWLGLCLGLGYVLPELPNSYLKRRLGVAPGAQSARLPWLFSFIDQTDSAVGCIIIYALFAIGSPELYVLLFFFGAVVHVAVNLVLWGLGLRQKPL